LCHSPILLVGLEENFHAEDGQPPGSANLKLFGPRSSTSVLPVPSEIDNALRVVVGCRFEFFIELIGVPVDACGLQVDALDRVLRRHPIRAVYVTPHHQFPTTVTMSAGRRLKLLDLARVHRIAIIEDDYDNEFHYEGRPVLPLASADRFGVVAYIGSFSKVIAPALRIGYIAAPTALIEQVAARRSHLDMQGDQVLEYAVQNCSRRARSSGTFVASGANTEPDAIRWLTRLTNISGAT
jgi:DNA-binding transcriptional MocR family regulator